jgi:RND family efflux transporter MFP subunit
MSRQKIQLSLIGIGVLLLFAWVVMTQGPLAPIKVTVEKIQLGSLSNRVFGVGTLKAKRSYNLAPTMTSRIKRVLVDQGDRVIVGQLLVEMDTVDLKERLNAGQRVADKFSNGIRAQEAQLAEAQSRLNSVSATFNRYQELRTNGFVSQETFDLRQHEKNAATALLAATSANLASAREEYARALADVRGIGELLSQTKLFSPTNGIVTARFAEPGSTMLGGQIALQLIDPQSLWVETRIAQKQAGQIRLGQVAEIVLRSQPQSVIAGKVARIDLISDAVTEERIVNVAFSSSDVSIGEYAEVTIKFPELNQVRSISSAAIKRRDKQSGVWVLQEGVVQFKPVTLGISTLDGRTQILEGLADNEMVIVYSQQQLRSGSKVKVVSELVKG